jgi:hypothetical protein
MNQQGFATFDQTQSEDWVSQVSGGFIEALDGVKAGHGAMSEAVDLREDEPHPVPLLPAGAEFLEGGGIGVLLSGEEAVEVVRYHD